MHAKERVPYIVDSLEVKLAWKGLMCIPRDVRFDAVAAAGLQQLQTIVPVFGYDAEVMNRPADYPQRLTVKQQGIFHDRHTCINKWYKHKGKSINQSIALIEPTYVNQQANQSIDRSIKRHSQHIGKSIQNNTTLGKCLNTSAAQTLDPT